MLKFLDEAHTLVSVTSEDGETVVVVERGDPRFDELVAQQPAAYEGDDAADALAEERARMRVSRLQARAALLQAGLLDRVERGVNGGLLGGGTSDALLKMAWAEATEFNRTSPTIAALAGLVGLDDEALDNLFRAAAAIRF